MMFFHYCNKFVTITINLNPSDFTENLLILLSTPALYYDNFVGNSYLSFGFFVLKDHHLSLGSTLLLKRVSQKVVS